jgi:hypothetical protein
MQLSQANFSGCAPILGYTIAAHPNCHNFNDRTFDWISQNRPDKVILSALWPLDQASIELIERTVARMNDLGIFVILIGETPVYIEPVPDILAKRFLRANPDAPDESLDNGRDVNSDILIGRRFLNRSDVVYLSPKQTFCQETECPLAGDDGMPLMIDNGHFTKRGAELLADRMFGGRQFQERLFSPSP